MKKEYDSSKARKNPYAKRLKKQVTVRVGVGAKRRTRAAAGEGPGNV